MEHLLQFIFNFGSKNFSKKSFTGLLFLITINAFD